VVSVARGVREAIDDGPRFVVDHFLAQGQAMRSSTGPQLGGALAQIVHACCGSDLAHARRAAKEKTLVKNNSPSSLLGSNTSWSMFG
jgi:hypothetical protein